MIAHVNESEPAVAEVIMGQTTKTENADKEQTPVGDDRFAEATSAATDSTFGTAGCFAPAVRPFRFYHSRSMHERILDLIRLQTDGPEAVENNGD